jgi:hypothetical protein
MFGGQFPVRMTVLWLLNTAELSKDQTQNVTIRYESPVID